MEAVRTIEHPIGKYALVTLNSFAYAGTGDVLKVQELLHICAEHPDAEKDVAKEKEGEEKNAAAGAAGGPLPALGPGGGPAAGAAGGEGKAEEKKSDADSPLDGAAHQAAVLGLALVTMGENIGSQMAIRSFNHLLQYGDKSVRRAVPLGIAMLHISNPDYRCVRRPTVGPSPDS